MKLNLDKPNFRLFGPDETAHQRRNESLRRFYFARGDDDLRLTVRSIRSARIMVLSASRLVIPAHVRRQQ